MGLWEVALAIAGAAGIGIILDRLSGGVIQSILLKIIDFIQDAVNFLLQNLPKPIKMSVFLILFVALGGVLYNYTIGAQYVCIQDDVYQVEITEGISANLWPADLRDSEFDRTRGGVYDEDKNIPDPELNTSQAVGVGSWRILKETNIFSADEFVEQSEITDSDILYSRDNVVYNDEVAFDRLVFALVSGGDVISQVWQEAIFRTDKNDYFEQWSGGDGVVYYQICHDRATDTCTLARTDASAWANTYGFTDAGNVPDFSDGCEGGVLGDSRAGRYGNTIGTVQYTLDENEILTGRVTENSPNVFNLIEFFTSPDLEEACLVADSEDRAREEAIYDALIGTDDDPNQPQFVTTYPINDGEESSIALYGVTRAPVLADINEQIYVDKTNPDPEADIDLDQNEITDLFDDAQLHENEQGDILTFTCNEETQDNPYDTRMYLGGIDIFDPKLMFLFVLISLIWGFYKSMNVF